MKSGGMKFWLQRGVAALAIPALIVFATALNQGNADESKEPVRFKLSDGGGESGKVIVVEQSPDKRDVNRVFDNGLRFKRDENGNVYRTGEFKEVAPRTIEKPEAKPVPAVKPMADPVEATEDVPEVKPTEKPSEAKQETTNVLPSLPSLDTLFPKIDFSGFDEAFDIFASENAGGTNKKSRAPGLKIKTAPVSPNPVPAVQPTPKAPLVQQQVEPKEQESTKPAEAAKPMPEVIVEAKPNPMPEVVEPPKQPKPEVVVETQPMPVPEVVQTPETPKPEIVPDEVVEASPSDIATEEVEQPQRNVDSVTGLPMLADIVGTDFSLPELALPELELPDLNLFFGTSSKPLIDEQGEVPAEIEQQAKVEEPLESSVEDMLPMELPMEDVVDQSDESAQQEQIAEKPVPEKASNTSLFELPSIDLGLGELFGLSTTQPSLDLEDDGEPVEQVAVEPMERPSLSGVHRVPGRKNLGASANKAKRSTGASNGTSYSLFSEFKIPEFNNPFATENEAVETEDSGVEENSEEQEEATGSSTFNLFSEFNIPEFNNPFDFGASGDATQESVAKAVKVPGLKKPVVPSPDSSLLDSLPELDSQRANVPGLKLMRTRAPKAVPMTSETSKEQPKQDDKELGTGVPTAPATGDKEEPLVDPDKILDEFKDT